MNWKHGLAAFLMIGATLLPAAAQDNQTTTTTTAQVGLSAEAIAALPQVNLTPLTPREDLMYDRWYMKVKQATDVYDAPNGTVVRHLDAGFVFVTALKEENGWTRINRYEWVPTDTLQSISWLISPFTGIPLSGEALPYPVGWVLVDSYVSAVPGVEATEDDPNAVQLKKYDRVNIYSSTTVVDENGKERVWYQVGPNQWLHQFNVSKWEALKTLPEGVDTDIWVAIDLYEQNVTLYQGTTPLFITLTGTGLDRWPTYEGLFHIYFRNERENMSWGTVGDDYYLIEEVPWTMYFDGGRALHGSYWHNAFGYRRSHGCVNLSITDANYLYEQVAAYMGDNTDASIDGPAVYVFSSGTYDIKQ